MTTYFTNCHTAEELKKTYAKLAKANHPDNGGDPEIMKAINAEFTETWPKLKDVHENAEGQQYTAGTQTTETASEFMDIIASLLHIPGISIEICGSWVWITGNTYPIHDQLKALHFSYSGNKHAWYFHRDEYHKKSSKKFTLEEIREKFGSEHVDSEKQEAIA
jgi:hypothetical protein